MRFDYIRTMIKATRTRTPRHTAGEDPEKRAAILIGAAEVFMRTGFDAASMNDICRAAGVSKSTLYVYFSNKEDLFEHLIAGERERLFLGLQQTLHGPAPLPDRLTAYAIGLANIVCSDDVIRAQRIVIGMVSRRQEFGARFYDGGAQRGHDILRDLLLVEVSKGTLFISDASLAAYQLIELASAGLWRRRLFGKDTHMPTPEKIRTVVENAVALFMAGYATKCPRP